MILVHTTVHKFVTMWVEDSTVAVTLDMFSMMTMHLVLVSILSIAITMFTTHVV